MISPSFCSCTFASVAIATVSLLAAPAQASSFFSFNGDARLENADAAIGDSSSLNFFPFDGSGLGQSSAGYTSQVAPAETFETRDIPLTKIAADEWTLDTAATNATGFPSFMSNFETSSSLSSRLTSFHLLQAPNGSFDGTLALWLDDGIDEVFYQGSFSSQQALALTGTTFSANLEAAVLNAASANATAVPTPGMLPGILTITLGMLRKRRAQ